MSEPKNDRRLVNEESLLLSPSLAILIGINEAIILQQVHYWLQVVENSMRNYKDGFYWTYNSVNKWQQSNFPFWSASTVKRTFNNLTKCGILITGEYNRMRADRSKWYRIDYERLITVMVGLSFCRFLEGVTIPLGQNDLMDWINMTEWQRTNMTLPIPDTSLPNNSSKNSLGRGVDLRNRPISFNEFLKLVVIKTEEDKEVISAIGYFLRLHSKRFGPDRHPKLKIETWQGLLNELPVINDDSNIIEVSEDDLITMIKLYFNKYYQSGCNFCITHFNDPGIKKVNYLEAFFY